MTVPEPAHVPNEPLDVGRLPRLDDDRFVAVDPRHALGWVAFLVVAAVGAVIAGVTIGAGVDDGWIPIAAGSALAVVLVAAAVLAWMEARRVGHQVRDHDVSLRRGLIVRTVETVPFRRVQHVSLTRGPLERALGLATIGVHSAGPDLSIPGLDPDDAGALRRLIVTRAGLHDAMADDRTSENVPSSDTVDERPSVELDEGAGPESASTSLDETP